MSSRKSSNVKKDASRVYANGINASDISQYFFDPLQLVKNAKYGRERPTLDCIEKILNHNAFVAIYELTTDLANGVVGFKITSDFGVLENKIVSDTYRKYKGSILHGIDWMVKKAEENEGNKFDADESWDSFYKNSLKPVINYIAASIVLNLQKKTFPESDILESKFVLREKTKYGYDTLRVGIDVDGETIPLRARPDCIEFESFDLDGMFIVRPVEIKSRPYGPERFQNVAAQMVISEMLSSEEKKAEEKSKQPKYFFAEKLKQKYGIEGSKVSGKIYLITKNPREDDAEFTSFFFYKQAKYEMQKIFPDGGEHPGDKEEVRKVMKELWSWKIGDLDELEKKYSEMPRKVA